MTTNRFSRVAVVLVLAGAVTTWAAGAGACSHHGGVAISPCRAMP